MYFIAKAFGVIYEEENYFFVGKYCQNYGELKHLSIQIKN